MIISLYHVNSDNDNVKIAFTTYDRAAARFREVDAPATLTRDKYKSRGMGNELVSSEVILAK